MARLVGINHAALEIDAVAACMFGAC